MEKRKKIRLVFFILVILIFAGFYFYGLFAGPQRDPSGAVIWKGVYKDSNGDPIK